MVPTRMHVGKNPGKRKRKRKKAEWKMFELTPRLKSFSPNLTLLVEATKRRI
jgi:hypothetical protein